MKNIVKWLWVSGCALSSVGALADSIHFEAVLATGYVPGIGRIRIAPAADGKFLVTHDKNKCSIDGLTCTKMYFKPFVVEGKIVEDRRPRGSLVIQLNSYLVLTETPIEGADGFSFSVSVTNESGHGNTVIPLHPVVTLDVNEAI